MPKTNDPSSRNSKTRPSTEARGKTTTDRSVERTATAAAPDPSIERAGLATPLALPVRNLEPPSAKAPSTQERGMAALRAASGGKRGKRREREGKGRRAMSAGRRFNSRHRG